jgi:hypothetical protein
MFSINPCQGKESEENPKLKSWNVCSKYSGYVPHPARAPAAKADLSQSSLTRQTEAQTLHCCS